MNGAAVRSALTQGSLPRTALGWREGMDEWAPLADAFAVPPPPPPRRPIPARVDHGPLGLGDATLRALSPDAPGAIARSGAALSGGVARTVPPPRVTIPHTRPIASPLALLMAVVVLAIADVLLVAVFDLTDLPAGAAWRRRGGDRQRRRAGRGRAAHRRRDGRSLAPSAAPPRQRRRRTWC
jgi:hypothetical protein